MKQNNRTGKNLLVFGMGYAATAIVEHVGDMFKNITVTNRTSRDMPRSKQQHMVFDGEHIDGNLAVAISNATHILVSIGPDAKGDPVILAAMKYLCNAQHLEWVGYLSTVGVYGDHDGEWVDEETRCRPISNRSVERLAAENAWQEMASKHGCCLAIFRLSGIYGPGRNALVNVEKGRSRRLVKKGQVFNRIHRDDIAQAAKKAIELSASGIFNITDDEPAPPQDVVTYVHQLRGSEPPPEIDFDNADITPMARSFYGENKRVTNAKSKADLGMKYKWPNYQAAFDAMWENDNWQ